MAVQQQTSIGHGDLRVLGGAMARVPKDATAFAHRDKELTVQRRIAGDTGRNRYGTAA